jgi:hypothetical protein
MAAASPAATPPMMSSLSFTDGPFVSRDFSSGTEDKVLLWAIIKAKDQSPKGKLKSAWKLLLFIFLLLLFSCDTLKIILVQTDGGEAGVVDEEMSEVREDIRGHRHIVSE